MREQRPEASSLRAARELLGVAADAGPAQLARAYRSEARRLHPDVSLEPDATERFWALEAAYHLVLGATLDAAGDALDAESGNAPTATTNPPTAPTDTPTATAAAPSRHHHRDPTVELRTHPTRRVPAPTTARPARIAWLAVGPARVKPLPRPLSVARPPSPGEL